MPDRNTIQRFADLLDTIVAAENPPPVLIEIIEAINKSDPETRENLKKIVLSWFDRLMKAVPHDVPGRLIERLLAETPSGTPAAEFLTVLLKAHESILNEAYRKVLRTVSHSYRSDGTAAKCPSCKSLNVFESGGFYEFTEMKCRDCGFTELLDDYQLEEWYPEPD